MHWKYTVLTLQYDQSTKIKEQLQKLPLNYILKILSLCVTTFYNHLSNWGGKAVAYKICIEIFILYRLELSLSPLRLSYWVTNFQLSIFRNMFIQLYSTCLWIMIRGWRLIVVCNVQSPFFILLNLYYILSLFYRELQVWDTTSSGLNHNLSWKVSVLDFCLNFISSDKLWYLILDEYRRGLGK